ncbi:MAG: S8 family peptidase [Kiritimatiellales bacterium]|nr:S8 family peptidase [Kiritimatiellales bacterium]
MSLIDRRYFVQPSEPPKEFEAARVDMIRHIEQLKDGFERIPDGLRYGDEFFYCLRAHPEALAKSFDFSSFIGSVSGMRRIGARAWNVSAKEVTQTNRVKKKTDRGVEGFVGKTIFVRSHISALNKIIALLNERETELTKAFIADVCRIEHLDALSSSERVMGFDNDWKSGRVEIVLHPSEREQKALIEHFQTLVESSGEDCGELRPRIYESNIAFISMKATRALIDHINEYNPLRSIRPLQIRSIPEMRDFGGAGIPAPLPPEARGKSSIKVGVFDGGIKAGHPLLAPYCNEIGNPSVGSSPDNGAVAHGTAVAGAILYGQLNKHAHGQPLPTPNVSVESFRVFPLADNGDIDLYEAIDLIEAVVPSRPDIKVYNLSFGPDGPILDDSISRFSYALDNLAHTHNVLFVVACGNAGEYGRPNNRIQSPSDMVNGLGVGAHDGKVKASYSCCGPGREGAKTKPDILAFGGSNNEPMHLVSLDEKYRVLEMGTSFSAPIVAGLAAQLIGLAERVDPLVARALIIHNAAHPENGRCFDYGYGCICEDVDLHLQCSDKTATILFQGTITPKNNVKLPIPIPDVITLSGKVDLKWTIAIESAVNDLDSLEYTSHCIEEGFYPNGNLFKFTDPSTKASEYVDVVNAKEHARDLEKSGWKMSALPKSESGRHATEETLRKRDLKWDTIIRNGTRKLARGLCNPALVLHAMSRNGVDIPVRFGVVVTISAPSYSGDIYNDIVTHIPQLVPVRVRAENEIRIRS